MNEDIYCDLDLVLSDLYELENDKDQRYEIMREIDNLQVCWLENGGFCEIFEYLLSNEKDLKEFKIIKAADRKLLIKFFDIYATINYLVKDNKTTNFSVRKFSSYNLAYYKYNHI